MMPETRKDAPLPPACPRCAALESEVARLTADLGDANMLATANNEVATSLHGQLESARALLRELAAAAGKAEEYLAFVTGLAGDLEWGQRRRALRVAEELREALGRPRAEAGGVG